MNLPPITSSLFGVVRWSWGHYRLAGVPVRATMDLWGCCETGNPLLSKESARMIRAAALSPAAVP
jgi:hypothetical protein